MLSCLFGLLNFVNRNALAVLADALEANHAGNLGEQGVVRASADIDARMDLGAALTNEGCCQPGQPDRPHA